MNGMSIYNIDILGQFSGVQPEARFMQSFVQNPNAPTNAYLLGLLTDPQTPIPFKWTTNAPLQVFFDDTGARAWSEAEKAAAMNAFASWQKVTNISFVATADRAQADIIQRFTASAEFLGEADLPGGTPPSTITYSSAGANFDNISPGGDSYQTMVHEIGHAIGLSHPHDGVVFPGVTGEQSAGTDGLNQHIWTAMSYVIGFNLEPTTTQQFGTNLTPMAFDIAAIQFLYGAKPAETGDTSYLLPTANQIGTGWSAIWDTGGNDTISGAGATSALAINLNAAPLTGPNAGGYVSWIAGVKGGFTIANGVVIENAIGGSGNDTLVGNTSNNVLTGGAGNDQITGGGGLDFARINAARSDATFGSVAGGKTVQTASDGTDTLVDIDRVQFNDAIRALDVGAGETAGQAYRIYKAAFARTPDEAGVSFWVRQMDGGKTLLEVSNDFLFQQEFIAAYGANGASLNAADYVGRLYSNVLGRQGEDAGIQFWTNELTSGARSNAQVLADFTDIPENLTVVQPTIADGFWYV
jgi:serralysin